MKHGKKPTVRQCELMRKWKLNPENWLVSKDTPEYMEVRHRLTDTVKRVPKGGRGDA